jgi:hypothetical protein
MDGDGKHFKFLYSMWLTCNCHCLNSEVSQESQDQLKPTPGMSRACETPFYLKPTKQLVGNVRLEYAFIPQSWRMSLLRTSPASSYREGLEYKHPRMSHFP